MPFSHGTADDTAGRDRPLVLLAPSPQSREVIFTTEAWQRFKNAFDVVELDGNDARFDVLLPEAFAIVGQPDLPTERLRRASALRVICNVEGNFFPNVDYDSAFSNGVYVLGCGPAYAQPVAEYALGLALDLARGITHGDRLFRAGHERYTIEGNADALLLRRSQIGLVGFGNLGRALAQLLQPFRATIRVHDPWLPDAVIEDAGLIPADLETLLTESRFVFILAAITDENAHMLDGQRLDLLPERARLVLVSRAAAVDFGALYKRIQAGRILAAIDVWPSEPMPADDGSRMLEGAVLSAHRAGGITDAFHAIGDMVHDDLSLVAKGLPPVRMQVAARELVTRYRSRPVDRRRT